MTDNVNIKLELPVQAVNMVLTALAKQPYEAVADLVQAIREQAIPQVPMPEVGAESKVQDIETVQ